MAWLPLGEIVMWKGEINTGEINQLVSSWVAENIEATRGGVFN